MMPVLFAVGPITIWTFPLFLLFAWVVFSFFFWRHLRDLGVEEERIFDLMFYGTIAAFVGGRLGFVLEHPELFSGWKWIRVATLWIQPGFMLYAAFIALAVTLLVLARQFHIRRAYLIDALAGGFGPSFLIGSIGAFLGGETLGRVGSGGMTVFYAIGNRYPVGLYEAVAMAGILVILGVWRRVFRDAFRMHGIYALWFFLLFSVMEFGLEFLKESRVYWGGLHINQWIIIGIFGEVVGLLIVRGGGKEWIGQVSRQVWHRIRIQGGALYAKFSKRHS